MAYAYALIFLYHIWATFCNGEWDCTLKVDERYYNESRAPRVVSTLRLNPLFVFVGLLLAAFVVSLFFAVSATQAQELLSDAQGEVQETAAPSGPTQQAAPVQEQAAPVQEQATEPVGGAGAGQAIGAAQQTTEPVVGTVNETAKPVAQPVNQTVDTGAQSAKPVVRPVRQTAEPVSGAVEQTTQPVDQTVEPVIDTVENTADPVLKPVQETVEPVVKPVQQRVEPVGGTVEDAVKPVTHTVDPVVQPVKETVDPVKETVDPVIKPVQGTVDPVIDPIKETVGPVVKPIQDTVEPVVKPVERPEPVVAPTHKPDELLSQRPQTTGVAIDPPAGLARPSAEPVVESTLDPVLRAERSAVVAPVLEEGAVQAGESISLNGSSGSPASVILNESEGSSSQGLVVSEQASVRALAPSKGSAIPSFSMGEHSSILDFATTAGGVQNGWPQPSPFSGTIPTIPTGAGSSSSGLASGLGVGGGLAALAILCALSPFGRLLLRSSRDFLEPTSALTLAIERPG